MLADIMSVTYLWMKALHIIAVISWMVGMFYLPRLFVYHTENGRTGSELSETFKIMELKLYKIITTPAMIVTWIAGLWLTFTPGVVDFNAGWFYVKFAAVLAMTGVHGWLGACRKDFLADHNTGTGRRYRLMNEAPTLLMFAIVIMVIVRPF